MKQCQIVGKIEPDELRREIIFAKHRTDMLVKCMDRQPKGWGFNRTIENEFRTWANILYILVRRIKPKKIGGGIKMKKLLVILLFVFPGLAFAQGPIYLPLTLLPTTPSLPDPFFRTQQPPQEQQKPVQKYNPHENRFQTTYPDSQLNYNPYENRFKYTRPSERPVYNPYENKFEFPE